jgi:hypothetical protein
MKTWKQNFFGFLAILAFAFTALSLTGCPPNDDGNNNGTTEQLNSLKTKVP